MAAPKSYRTDFLIGAKLLSSFQGAMNAAQNRMKTLEKSVKGVSTAIKGMTGLMVGALAALGGRAIFSKIFEGAEEGAKAAEQATRKMIASLLQLRDINAKGRQYSEQQVKMLQDHTEQLAKQSVYSKEILNAGEAQMAVAAIPPKYIKQAIGPMQDLLAVSRGVTATQEDMQQLAGAFGTAIKTGMTKQLKQFGIILDPNQKKYLQYLSKMGMYQEAYNFLLERMKFAAGEAARLLQTPQGRIMKAQEKIREMGIRIHNALLPDKAAMEEAWTAAMLGLEPILTKFEQVFTHVMTWAAKEFGDLVARLQQPDGVNALNDFVKAVQGLGAAFGVTSGQGKSLGTMLGDWLVKEIQQTTADFINLERVVMNVKRHWTIFEGAFIGGWQKIEEAFKKVYDLWEKFKNSLLTFKPPWWMPGVRGVVSGGQAIAKSGAAGGVWNWLKGVNAAATARVAGGGGGGGGGGGAAPGWAVPPAASAAAPTAAAAAGVAPTAAASAGVPSAPAAGPALSAIQAEREPIIKELQQPGTRELFAAAMRAEGASPSDQANVAEALVNRAAAHRLAGSYKGIRHELTGGFYGPVNRGEIRPPSAKQLAVADKVLADLQAGRNVLGGRTDQGMINEIKGAKAQFGEDWYGFMGIKGEKATAAYRAAQAGATPMQFGGIATRPMLAHLAERGAEAVIPLNRGGGKGPLGALGTMLNFTPNITIHGGANMTEEGLVSHLRDLTREFIAQFQRAQHHERRLSYEGGYG